MRRSVAVLFLLFASATQLLAGYVAPSGLAPGSQYQLIFVTLGKHDAISNAIADYNAFVTTEAALSSDLPSGLTWKAVGSTATVDARDNAPSALPTYNTQGIRITTAAGLYTGSLLSPIRYDQFGDVGVIDIFTGSNPDGTGFHNGSGGPYTLGTGFDRFGNAFLGRSDSSTGDWISRTISNASANPHSFYALSSPITVPVPEPSTLFLAGLAGLTLLAFRRIC